MPWQRDWRSRGIEMIVNRIDLYSWTWIVVGRGYVFYTSEKNNSDLMEA
jgi:hypothetical protein